MNPNSADRHTVTLFLAGDVMTGRGIDQILPHPSAPQFWLSTALSRECHPFGTVLTLLSDDRLALERIQSVKAIA